MKHKMNDAEDYLKQVTKDLGDRKENLSKVVRENTVVRREYMDIVNIEVNKVWKDGKNKNENKANELVRKFIKEETIPEMHLGVLVSDEKLDEYEMNVNRNIKSKNDEPAIYAGIDNEDETANYAENVNDDKQDKPAIYAGMDNNDELANHAENVIINEDKPAIYAGIEGITVEQKELLMMPPNHRVYPRLELESFETELEKAGIKATWEKLSENRNNEEHFKELETGETKESLKVFDEDTKTVNFRNLKATDFKNNKRINIVEENDDKEEIRMNHVKNELKEVFIKHMKEHCDNKGNQVDNNLSVKQVKAMKNLKMKMKTENLVCLETDKTGKFALDTKENYINKIKKHIAMDEVITTKEVTKIENVINKHAEHAARITMAGENTGQTKRVKSNFKTKDNQIPIIHGTSKDHKEIKDENEGPEVRPIMGAVVGPNVGLSNFLGKEVVRRVAEDAGNETVCKSTEELLSVFESYNKNRIEKGVDKKKVVLGSMDIKKWYPSTLIRPSAKVIKQMIVDSNIEFVEIEYDSIEKYLGEHMSREEILEEQLEEIVYMKIESVGEKKKKIKDKDLDDPEVFRKPLREPNKIEKRNMLAKSIEIMIIITLENHVYKFGNEIRRQREGGPIGLSLTGEIADCYMIHWDKQFLKKLEQFGIEVFVYERFKDDITIVVESLEEGTKYENSSLINDSEKRINDEDKSDEEITMNVLRDIADSMDNMLQFTIDFPNNNKSGKIPILDIEASISKEKSNKIEFEFYEKPTKKQKSYFK